ncbi:uncharacterized protein ighd isoform X1 [Labeo rohita]|uniref:uncharacterized protein ighd isoform X1 n=1 Tax=Labeo rohita TaxID=84645 RepID=UPI0021E2DA0F|nr:uncharacterized protein ighd isoform X1 [Labeo rohita]
MVTVSSAQPSAPKSIFPMSQCTSDSEFLTIGCLARGFSPADSVTFKWKNHADKELSDFVQYPAFGREGDYAKISHMRVRKSEWDAQKPYKCEASNSKGTVYSRVAPAPKRVNKPTIALLSRKDGDRTVLECQLNDYFPDKLTVQWLEGDRSASGQIDKKFQNTDKGEKTYTYISQLPISAPYEDKKYTCKATFNSEEFKKEYKTCEAQSLFKPSVQIKRDIQQSTVTIFCVVEAPDNTKVSWLTDNVSKTTTKEAKDPSNNIVSTLTLSKNEWLTLKTVVCIAKHPCVPEVRNEIPAGYIKKDPVVVIRRTLMKSAQADSAVLECVVNDLPSGEVCINFQANNVDISDLSCVDWAPSENIWYLTKHFTIPSEHQKNGKVFTCKVHRDLKSWTSQSTGSIFGDATIELSVISSVGQSSSDSQKLLCSVTGFDPKIKWLSQFREKTGRDPDITVMEDGRVKAYSEILVPRQEWNQGVTYTCQATSRHSGKKVEKSTSVCTAPSLFKPSVQIKRDIQQSTVTISCVVEAPDNTKVSWLTDNVSKTTTKEAKDPSNNIVSTLTLSKNEWLTLKTVVCIAKHPCVPEVRKEIPAGYIKKDPVVVIRRTLMKSAQADSAVLECVVNDLPSGEVCITFQANNVDISDLSCVDWTPSENIWYLTKHFTIPSEHQKNGKVFTCKVHRDLKSWTSKYTGNIFADATIELSVVPSVGQSSSDSQKLLCSVTGFDPKIKWLSQSREKPGSASDVTVMEDGRVKVYSEILVPQQEWTQGVTYTCQATSKHSGKTVEKHTSVCTAQSLFKPSVQIKRAHLRDIIQESKVTVSCVAKASDNTKLSWLTDNVRKPATNEVKDPSNNIVSTLTLPRNEWLTLKTVVCIAKHPCFPEERVEIPAGYIKKDPVVVVRRTLMKSAQADSAVLECVVNDLPSGEVCINFQANNIDISDLSCVDWAPSENIWYLTKHFTIPSQHQRNGRVFTCKVHRLFKSWTSQSTGNIFGDATIELSVISSVGQSSSDSQKLLCSVTGFDPKIKWLSQSREKPGRASDITVMEDGRVKVYSEILVPRQEWNQGVTYTCQATSKHSGKTVEKSTSVCTAQSSFKPSVQIKRAHLRDIIQESKVTVSCVVEASDNTKLSWLTDNVRKPATREVKDPSNNIVSTLTLPRNEWLTLKTVVCIATHPCFPEVRNEIPAGYIKKDPVVVIRRTLMKSAQADSAVLECVVNDLPSGEVCINFQANNVDISDLSCVDWAPSENIWYLTKHFTIPSEHRKNGKVFTCKVHRLFKSWTSKSTGNIFGDATIELSVISSVGQSSSDSQKLLCSVTGFDPKIKWLSQSREKPGSASNVTVMEDGRVKVYSEILVPQQEWTQGVTYICQADSRHSGKTVEKSTSVCTAQSLFKPSVHIKRSHLRDIIQQSTVTISCVVEAPDNTKVSWLTDNVRKPATKEVKDQSNNIVSNLTLSKNEWLTLKTVVCIAKHPCFPEERDEIPAGYIKKDPVVVIRRTLMKSAQADSAELECVVNDLPSGEVCITFQANNVDISDLSCVDWTPSENIWYLTKHFTIPIEHQKNGKTFTCKVHRLFKSWTSQSTENIFAIRVNKPTLALLSRKDGDRIVLECQLNEYFPDKLTVQWLEGDKSVKGQIDKKFQNTDKGEKNYTYISQLPISAPYEDKKYTCKATFNSEEIKKEYKTCEAQSFFKPSIQIKRDIIQQSKVTISCVVEAPDNTKVSWLTDDVKKPATKEVKDPSNNIVSNLTLSRNEWLTLKTVICIAKHPCFPEERDEIPAGYIKKDPVVVIRRTLMKSAQADSAVLECVVNDLPSGEVCITFQANNVDISDLSCVDWAPSESIWYLTKHFTIPSEHQKNGNVFTCKVHRLFKSWTSQSTGNMFGDATIELSVISSVGQSSSDSQKLLCSVTGFDPKIKWLSQSREKTGSSSDATVMEDGRVKVYSEILVPQQERTQGVTYTCQTTSKHSGKTVEKSTSVCTVQSLFKPSVQIKRAHLRDIIQQSKVTVSCVVEAPDNTKVSWLTDKGSKTATKEDKDQPNNIVSNLTLSKDEWLTLKTIVCIAKHPCFPEVRNEIPAGYIKKDPVVVIRRTLMKSAQADSAVLECVVNDLPSGEVCINFQANNIDISDLSCVDWAPSENIWYLTKHFTIPSEHQKNGKVFTCKVQRLFKSWTSQSTGYIFGDATIELFVVPSVGQSSSDSQKLLCSVTGFDPKIKWLSHSREKTGSASAITVMEDGRVKVYSEILVPRQDWTQGVTYSCQTTSRHSGRTAKKSTSVCTAQSLFKPSVQIKRAHLRDIIQESKVTVSCVVEAPDNTEVSWLTDNVNKTATEEVKDPSNNIVSTLTLSKDEWLNLKTVVCIATHPCFPEERDEIPAGYIKKDPVVVIRRTLMKSAQADSAVLECVVNDLPSGEVCITFQANNIDISDLSCADWAPSENIWYLTTHFTIPSEHQKNGKVFTCKVHRLFKSWTSKSTGNIFALFEEAIFLNENKHEAIAQDTVEETWNMACAFLALFLISLIYGCTVTLVKVKPT